MRGVPALPRLPKLPGLPTIAPAMVPARAAGEGPPAAPAGWPGSDLEWLVNWWLTQHKIDFQYQAPFLGGRQSLGGQVADFVIPDRRLILGPQGEYWHYASTEKRARTLLGKMALQAQGWTVVFMMERDLKQSLSGTMEAAMRGQQLFRD